jgi:glycosyltransferase involved in cell wall biosynthesis
VDAESRLQLSVIIPARNEEDCVGGCLWSLVRQQEPGFELGNEWEILLVNDGSTDGTKALAESFAGVTVLEAGPPPRDWTGKANAAWTGAQAARGEWLLFTDADTVHEPGSAQRAVAEAERHGVGMLSYSPRQLVKGLAQRAVMPLIFGDLAATYAPAKVNDPGNYVAAANGQFLLVRRDTYEKIGGHAAVKSAILEDVELARIAKHRRLGLRFRYAPEQVSARMYRSFGAMWQGWTKNLGLLFGNAPALAGMRLLQLAVLIGIPLLMWFFATSDLIYRSDPGRALYREMGVVALCIVWLRALWGFYSRVAKANFRWRDAVWAPLGVPLYATMLWQSWFRLTVLRRVEWKGREIGVKG